MPATESTTERYYSHPKIRLMTCTHADSHDLKCWSVRWRTPSSLTLIPSIHSSFNAWLCQLFYICASFTLAIVHSPVVKTYYWPSYVWLFQGLLFTALNGLFSTFVATCWRPSSCSNLRDSLNNMAVNSERFWVWLRASWRTFGLLIFCMKNKASFSETSYKRNNLFPTGDRRG